MVRSVWRARHDVLGQNLVNFGQNLIVLGAGSSWSGRGEGVNVYIGILGGSGGSLLPPSKVSAMVSCEISFSTSETA